MEALLHAFLPHKFVDHTHSIALLALADQPDAEAICREVYGDRVALVPYVMPGFDLALAAARAYEQAEERARAAGHELEGMVLLQHGLFSFGATAQQSYERMISLVGEAEDRIDRARSAQPPSRQPAVVLSPASEAAAVLPILRGGSCPGRGCRRGSGPLAAGAARHALGALCSERSLPCRLGPLKPVSWQQLVLRMSNIGWDLST